MNKVIGLMIGILTIVFAIVGCSDAHIASRNISKSAEQFEIERRIVFYNGITNQYMLSIEGFCSLEHLTKKVSVTCKTGDSEYKRHTLGLSDNVTYFSEQIREADVSVYHYRIIFKPEAIVPNIDLETSLDD